MVLNRLRRRPDPPAAVLHRDGPFDAWLSLFGDRLAELDAAVESEGAAALPRFRELDDDLWTVLLTRAYEGYPAIRELMPRLPSPDLQLRWNGAVGLELLTQGKVFYRRARGALARPDRSTPDVRVLDFGCGWGRLTRFFMRDVPPGSLFGCDPVEEILDVCRESGVLAEFARCEVRPTRLPFDTELDLVTAFSVFTHLSEPSHEACLRAIHASLAPGGLLVATIRSPGYLLGHELGGTLLAELDGEDPLKAFERPQYLFAPHPAEPDHPQFQGGEMDYGEAVISLPYVRERWSPLFELLDVSLLTEDMHQVALTLRRRD